MKHYLKHLFQLILSPGHGWEDIAQADTSPRELAMKGYYPLAGLAALSVFMQGVYHHALFLTLLMRMMVTFLVYFTGYFFGVFMLSLFAEPMLSRGYDERRAHTFVLYSLGLLALITLLINCLPVTREMLFFLPLYAALVEWKGIAYMGVKADKTGPFMLIAILGILCPIYLFFKLFSLFFG